jgi:mono/diheme cytochrome c family protein
MRKAAFAISLLLLSPVLVASAADAPADAQGFAELVKPLLRQYCIDCHGPDVQEARLRFDTIDGFHLSDRHLWTSIHEQLSAGAMPPAGSEHPSAPAKGAALAWIAQAQRGLEPGSVRRLNRREFGAALRDITGVTVDFEYSMPGDSTVEGFDTGAEGLQDAADAVAQMMEITRRAVESIRFLEPPRSETLRVDLVNVAKEPQKAFAPWVEKGVSLNKFSAIARPGVGALLEPMWPRDRSNPFLKVPVPADRAGVVRIRFSVGSFLAFPEVPNPILWVECGGRVLDRREITGPTDLEYQVQVEDSLITSQGFLSVALTPRVEIGYRVPGFENEDTSDPRQLPGGMGLFRPVWSKTEHKDPGQQPRPFVVLKQVELEPNFVAAWPPAEWQVDLGAISDSPATAEKLLALWMDRAYRRPVREQERSHFLKFYRRLRDEGLAFDPALRSTFQAVLMSSPFRHLDSTAHEDRGIADHAVASRLSFMLVGSPPDAELRSRAAAGELRRPEVLQAQVERLLADPRSYAAFVRPFLTQWLELDQPITLVDDHLGKASYQFRRHLQDSMREETFSYINRLLAKDRPARELVASDWTMMNDALARHYGYDGLQGGQMRPVTLRPDDSRGGGIMSHAGIQSMLCWMGDNWVIYRGAWTARNILDAPPQLPPLAVPELDAKSEELSKMSPRELMAHHRQDQNCAVCHTRLDPIGFAFQNFDISGRWRNVEYESYDVKELDSNVAWRGKGETRPVDTVGQLPRGEEFRTYAEFKETVASRYLQDTVRGLLKSFMLYATGRKPDIDDMAEIRRIMETHAADGYPLRKMLLAVFQTKAFLEH